MNKNIAIEGVFHHLIGIRELKAYIKLRKQSAFKGVLRSKKLVPYQLENGKRGYLDLVDENANTLYVVVTTKEATRHFSNNEEVRRQKAGYEVVYRQTRCLTSRFNGGIEGGHIVHPIFL